MAAGLLSGITRKIVLELAFDNKIPAAEENFTPEELKDADECFLTSSTKELVPITKIDGISIGSGRPGELTKRLHQIYRQHVKDYINRQRGVQDEILGDKY